MTRNLRHHFIIASARQAIWASALVPAFCSDAKAAILSLTGANVTPFDIVVITPPASQTVPGSLFMGNGLGNSILEGESTAPPGGFEWGWSLETSETVAGPLAPLSFDSGGGGIAQPAGQESFFELTGAINGVGDQDFLAGFVTWESIEPEGETGAIITAQVHFSTIEGSPLNIGNTATFGALQFAIDCGDVSCVTADPTATVTSLTLTYSGKGSVVPEPSTWAMMLLGFVGLGFVGCHLANVGSNCPSRQLQLTQRRLP
jgi:hypothetical protein